MGISKARGFVLADRALGRTRSRLRPHRRRRAPGGPVLGVAPADREPGPARDHRDRRPQPGPVGHVGRPGQRPRRPRGEVQGVRLGGRALRRPRPAHRSSQTLEGLQAEERPKIVIAHTRKGGGVSFMEPERTCRGRRPRCTASTPAPRAPTSTSRAGRGDRGAPERAAAASGRGPVELVEAEPPEHRSAPKERQRLVKRRLRRGARRAGREGAAARRRSTPTCGSTAASSTFRERFPERFFECGIAEQDMVSQAGAMALAGLLPVVHSFACFLSTRPNEQIYNNATEGTKIIYAGSLAGLVPGGPGHSHQSVRDISALGAVPGHGADRAVLRGRGARRRVDWAVHRAPGLGLPAARQRAVGARLRPAGDRRGSCPGAARCCARPGTCSSSPPGPVMVAAGWHAADLLARGRDRGGPRRAPVAARRRRRLARRGRRRRADRHARQPLRHRRPGGRGARGARRGRPRGGGARAEDRRHRGAEERRQRRDPARARPRRRRHPPAGPWKAAGSITVVSVQAPPLSDLQQQILDSLSQGRDRDRGRPRAARRGAVGGRAGRYRAVGRGQNAQLASLGRQAGGQGRLHRPPLHAPEAARPVHARQPLAADRGLGRPSASSTRTAGSPTSLFYLDNWFTCRTRARTSGSPPSGGTAIRRRQHVVKVFLYLSDVGRGGGPVRVREGQPAGQPLSDTCGRWGEEKAKPTDEEMAQAAARRRTASDDEGPGRDDDLLRHERLPPRRLREDDAAGALDLVVRLADAENESHRFEVELEGREAELSRTPAPRSR